MPPVNPPHAEHVPTPAPAAHPEVWMPPAPPGESSPEAVEKTLAIADLLARLGPETEPRVLSEHLKHAGLDVSPEEAATIQQELVKRGPHPAAAGPTAPEGRPGTARG